MPSILAQTLLNALVQAGPSGLRQAALAALALGRNLDPPGALAVLEGDPELAGMMSRLIQSPGQDKKAEFCRDLARRLEELAQAQHCLGCGTCCRTSSPTLYASDLELVGGPSLTRADLVTLRPGERAFSARLGRGLSLEQELVKLRWREGGACLHLQGSRCAAYARRPLQCRHLECWSGRHAGQLEETPRLSRAQIYAGDSTALALVAEYEAKLPASRAVGLLEEAARGGDQAPLLAWMELEHRLRAGVQARYGYPAGELDLLLGRPSWELAHGWGLILTTDGQGRPSLKRTPAPA